jgi:capsid protein
MFRFNQGRAVSPLASALISLIDLHETVSNEALAAKYNAQLVAQIIHTASEDGGVDPEPGAFDGEAGAFDGEGGEPVETVAIPKNEALKNIGLKAQEMPYGRKLELIDTKRPNPNMPGYVDFVTGLIGGTRGLGRVYSTLKAQTSFTAFRGEQIMTWQSFRDMQKELERDVCDWAARLAIARAIRTGEIKSALPEGWERMIAWTWPKMIEVSEKDAQSALQLKLQNGVTSLKRELGPGEYEKVMAERKAEKKDFDDAGLIYPGEASVSGAIKPGADNDDSADGNGADGEEPETEGGENADA